MRQSAPVIDWGGTRLGWWGGVGTVLGGLPRMDYEEGYDGVLEEVRSEGGGRGHRCGEE